MQRTMNDGSEQTFLFESDETHEPHDERECTTKLINDLRSTIDDYSHRLSTLQLENESLLQQLTVIEEQNGEYLLRQQNSERDLCALKQQLKRDAEEQEETIAELEQSLKNCEESKRCVDQQLSDLKQENAALVYEIDNFKDKYNDCEQTVKEMVAREAKLLQQINETQFLLNTEVEQNARLSTALDETRDMLNTKNEELRTIANKLDDMKREMTEKDNEMTGLKQVLQLVDVIEEVDEDSNGTVETDEAVDCNVYSDEFSSLESNRSGDNTCFVPRTSTAIDVFKRRRRRKVIVKRRNQKSFWDELQSEHPEVIYALHSLNRDRDSTFDEASVENSSSSDFIDSLYEPIDADTSASDFRTALPMLTEAEANTLLGAASGQALRLLDVLAKDSLKIARTLSYEAKRRIESISTNTDIGTIPEFHLEPDSPAISFKENEENYSELLPKVVVDCEQENEDMHCIENDDELIGSHEHDSISNYDQRTCVDDQLLQNLSLDIDTDIDYKELSKEEIEAKFTSLALAFNTDKLTIKQRLELQAHHREVAEEDAGKELYLMRDSINLLNRVLSSLLNDSLSDDSRTSLYELFPQIHQNIEIVQRCLNAISSRSQLLGSIKEELRLSKAVDLILLHVENLKRERDKERFKLKEARKLLINASQSAHKSSTRSESFAAFDERSIDEQTDEDNTFGMHRYQRSISVAIPTRTLNAFRVRRASDASALTHSHSRSNQSPNVSSIINRNNIPLEIETSYDYIESASIGTQTENDTIWNQQNRSTQRSEAPSLTLPAIIAILFVVFGLFVDTNIPPFWSWEDMFRKLSERIVSKEKVSECQ